MRFALDAEQREFGRTLGRMLAAADTPSAVRAWARGDHKPGLAVWEQLAQAGVFGLAVPEAFGGTGPLPVEVAVAFTELGRYAVPGPVVEAVAVTALLARLAAAGRPVLAEAWLPRVGEGAARVTAALPTVPGGSPYALDTDVCDGVFAVPDGADDLFVAAGHGPVQPSLDPARRLALPHCGAEPVEAGRAVREAARHAAEWAAFAAAAQVLGVGLALLERTVAYVGQRRQFGVAVGGFQAVKHRLADTRAGLEFAGPLVHGAAVALAAGAPGAGAEVAAAKAAASDAAYAAARTALQLHGAIGYTAEYDLSLWLGKARALRSAWGSPADCRARTLDIFSE
ncbi:acyl-CoA dehydrogenase family protein [Streptomyces sp. NPDC008001]|uniref:acyl-CoA dehydrogenase family protein n=1 Tax=Streptomyces sp. NPDC008001 TaxID=3364804 RepID=UPI0036EF05B6